MFCLLPKLISVRLQGSHNESYINECIQVLQATPANALPKERLKDLHKMTMTMKLNVGILKISTSLRLSIEYQYMRSISVFYILKKSSGHAFSKFTLQVLHYMNPELLRVRQVFPNLKNGLLDYCIEYFPLSSLSCKSLTVSVKTSKFLTLLCSATRSN